jgi:Nose resistant-to-fluoxetine protein, N-terminal domain
MYKSSKALLLTVFMYLLFKVQCHELLIDFLKIEDKSLQVRLTKTCENDLKTLRKGIESDEVWALKVRDASGRSSSGFMWGNNFWLGAERACFLLNKPPQINLIKSANRKMFDNMTQVAAEIPVEYRVFYATHTSTVQFDADLFNKSILHVGLCFPKSCNQKEADVMARIVFENKFRNDLLFGDLKYVSTKTLNVRKNFFHEPFVVLLL